MSSPNKVSQELPAALELRRFFGIDADLKKDSAIHNFSLTFPLITTSLKHAGNGQQSCDHPLIANQPDVKIPTISAPSAFSVLSSAVREASAISNFDTIIPREPVSKPAALASLSDTFRPQAIKTHRLRKNRIGRVRSEEVKDDKCTTYKQDTASHKNHLSNNFDEVRRSKRNKNAIICYNEDKLMVSSALNKRSCVESLGGISSRSQPRIRTGVEYQATDIPEYLGDYFEGSQDNDEHGEETLWLPPMPSIPLDEKHLDEYCAIAQKHQDLSVEDALKALMKNGYDILPTLERLEEYIPTNPTVEWTEEEADIFDDYITSRNIKPFRRVAKQLSSSKTLADVVEYYYRVKKMRCFSTPHKICPHRVSISPSHDTMRVLPRTNCLNCVQSLFQTKASKILRRRYDLCLPCEFYMRLTSRNRPFTVLLGSQEIGNGNGASTSSSYASQLSGNGRTSLKTSNTLRERKCHEGCFFKPRISALINSKEWNNDEILKCLKAIKKHGSDWKAVAEELSKRSIFEIMQFYNENRQLYSLDTIIALSKSEKNDGVSAQVALPSTNGSTCSKYNQRILSTSSAAALK